ncbi:transient receptor potential cation channel subfamily A member 1-like isoform X2 [Oratosquilla oratoria]
METVPFADIAPRGNLDSRVQQLLKAVERRSMEEVVALINSGVPVNGYSGSFHETALHLSVQQKWAAGVRYLLSEGASVYTKNQFSQTPLHYAAAGMSVECIKLLLESARPGAIEHRDMRGHTPLHDAATTGCADTIEVLLREGALVNCTDSNKETPLHKAAKSRNLPAVVTLLNNGADLSAKDINNESVLMYILRHIPGGMEVIFDHCLVTNTNVMTSKTLEVSFDFAPFAHPSQHNQVKHLRTFIKLAHAKLLSHPLCETFLLVKWRSVRRWFLIEVILFFLYAVFITILTANKFVFIVNSTPEKFNTSESVKDNGTDIPQPWTPISDKMEQSLEVIVIVKTVFFILHELLTLWQKSMAWFRTFSSVLDMIICILVMVVIIPDFSEWQKHCAIFLVLLLWIQMMLLIGRFPDCGIYVLMITRVSLVFLRIFFIYIFLLFAFSLSFYITIPKDNLAFSTPYYSFSKTLTMMIGELDFDSDFIKQLNSVPYTSLIIFITFTIFVSIILSNLLVALAVNDVQGLRSSAHLERLKKQTELVFHMEKTFEDFCTLADYFRLSGLVKLLEKCAELCRHNCKNVKVFLLPYHPQKSRKLFTMERKKFVVQKLPQHLLANVWERLRVKEKALQERRSSSRKAAGRTLSNNNNNSEDIKNSLKFLEANIIEAMSSKMENATQMSNEMSERLEQLENKLEMLTSLLLKERQEKQERLERQEKQERIERQERLERLERQEKQEYCYTSDRGDNCDSSADVSTA